MTDTLRYVVLPTPDYVPTQIGVRNDAGRDDNPAHLRAFDLRSALICGWVNHRHWQSYVVLPPPRPSKIFMPKTRPALGPEYRIFKKQENTMSVRDAEPDDIYVDSTGKLWRCVSICHLPTVVMEEVEGRVPKPVQDYGIGVPGAVTFQAGVQNSIFPDIIKDRKTGGVDGLMWTGFKRIWRKEKADG